MKIKNAITVIALTLGLAEHGDVLALERRHR